MFQYKQFYVCALVDVLIKCLYEMHGATIKIESYSFVSAYRRYIFVARCDFVFRKGCGDFGTHLFCSLSYPHRKLP